MGIVQRLSVLITAVLLFSCLSHTNARATQQTPVQDPAFEGAGTQAGLRIWRIEVSMFMFLG
jgi:hypothetical protein